MLQSLESSVFASRYVRALGQLKDHPLDVRERAQVVRAYRTLVRDQAGRSWFDTKEHAILTEAGTLAPAETAVYVGDNLEVRTILAKYWPDHCLAAEVRDLGPAELMAVLVGLRLDSVERQRRDVWVRIRLVPRGIVQVLDNWPADRVHLGAAVRNRIPDVPPDLDLDGLCVKIVEGIERRIELPSAEAGRDIIEPADVYLQIRPLVLFLTDAGRAELDEELLRLGNLAEYERQQRLLATLRNAWHEARSRVEELALDQKKCLLYDYRIAYYDPSFRKSDQELDRQHKSLDERWANFLADPGRIAQVIRKHTTDLGYGKQTIARELIQNIDDAYRDVFPSDGRPPWVEFRQQHGALIVSHAGRRFTAEDLERICGLGGSAKSQQVQIGRFGLGFKSVLGVTTEPIILSHPYAFTIKHVVVPEWLEPEGERCRFWHDWRRDHALTRFILQSDAGQRLVDELVERLVKLEDLAPRVLLFLDKLSEIRLRAGTLNRRVTRVDLSVTDGLFPGFTRPAMFEDVQMRVRRLEIHEEGQPPSIEVFLQVEGRARVRVSTTTGPQEIGLRCGVAFPWDPDEDRFGSPLASDSWLYLFLPTKTRTGLPFLVHGEFLTNLGRTDIDGENQTNAGLTEALALLVAAILKAAFARHRDDRDGLRTVTRLAPWPGDGSQEAVWLRPIRGVFTAMLRADEPVVLTVDGRLARPSQCAIGKRVAHAARGPRFVADPSCSLDPLVDPEIETEVARAAAGTIRTLTGTELVKSLFPSRLKRAKAVLRVRTLLRVLYEQQGDDLTQWTERDYALAQLSLVPCMPDERGGIVCPAYLEHPERITTQGRRPDLSVVAGEDEDFRRWIIENRRWAPARQPPVVVIPGPDWYEVFISSQDRERIWAHNLRLIANWWSRLDPQGHQDIANAYSLIGDHLWPILDLGDCPVVLRAERLREALHEDTPGHERLWFRVLCLANIGQSGRRYAEGVRFLETFNREFDGFERLWKAPDDAVPGDTVGELIRQAIASYIRDRGGPNRPRSGEDSTTSSRSAHCSANASSWLVSGTPPMRIPRSSQSTCREATYLVAGSSTGAWVRA